MNGTRLLENLVGFGAALRAVGIPVTPSRVAELARALTWVELGDREQVFRTARALLVSRREDLALFETVFNTFWRAPDPSGPRAGRRPPPPRDPPRRKPFVIASYAAFRARAGMEEREVADRAGTWTAEERFGPKRFSEMTDEELREARRLLARFRWDLARRVTRRRTPDPAGSSVDLRRVLRQASRLGALPGTLPRRTRVEKERPVVLLADVSGSMERHAKLVLHLFHTLVRSMSDVEAFVFGTRLTRITPYLRLRNVDRALGQAGREVVDWAGGTRIGESLGAFNRIWSRRVLRRGAVVVVVSDGCDRGDPTVLAREMRYLKHRCHRLIWLNPQAGQPRYEPRVAGMAAALPFADHFLPAHDIQSLREFAEVLTRARRVGRRVGPRRPVGRRSGPGPAQTGEAGR